MVDTGPTMEAILHRNPRERMKAEKHPLDILSDLPELIQRGYEEIPEEDIVRLQWYGVSHDRPRVGFFMVRIRLPNGILTPEQFAAIGRLAARYRNYAEITTRQDIQLHWVPLKDLPDLFATVQKYGMTVLGGEGDTVRNITGCPVAGFDREERFDSTPEVLLLHRTFTDPADRDLFNLPRKTKVTISACAYHCNAPEIHDIAFVGMRKERKEGYAVWVGGGLSTNPRIARPLGIFIPRDQVLEVARAILDIWREDLANRLSFVKARLKFFVDKIGPERYRQLLEERLGRRLEDTDREPRPLGRTFHYGIHPQKQEGLFYIGFPVVAGRLRGDQILRIADLAAQEGLAIRLSQRQNLILANVPEDRLVPILSHMEAWGFPIQTASFRANSTACTGGPFCNFSFGSSKDLLVDVLDELDRSVGDLGDIVVQVDGCPHACAQHWVGDIGLQASYVRNSDGTMEEALMIILGGGYGREAGIGRVVVKRASVPQAMQYLLNLLRFYRRSEPWPSFAAFARAFSEEQLLRIMETGAAERAPEVAAAPTSGKPLVVRMGEQRWELWEPMQVRELLQRLGVSPDTVVVAKNGTQVNEEEWLSLEDEVEILYALSGGSGGEVICREWA